MFRLLDICLTRLTLARLGVLTLALLFLAFDMEMAFMYPWAVVYQQLGLEALVDMGVFLLILFLGLLYGWSQGAFRRQ